MSFIADTDSLIIEFRSHDPVNDLKKVEQTMDFSNFAPCHVLYNVDKTAKLFCMKIEMGAHRIIGFCALKVGRKSLGD